jgi:hypothetical protein
MSMTLVKATQPPFGCENIPQLIEFPNTHLNTVRWTVACLVLSTNVLRLDKSIDGLYQRRPRSTWY